MKKILSFCLAAALLVSCTRSAAPGDTTAPRSDTRPPADATSVQPETEPVTQPPVTTGTPEPLNFSEASAEELEKFLRETFPETDGSTSTLPLDKALRAAIGGIAEYATVIHSSTHASFGHLINKSKDLIFSVPVSPEQEEQAKNAGVTIEQYAISKEAFVFVLNAENPVSALTQQELRDIYSGKITNWKEVGGDDAPITAFQRNEDSGSQNYIKTFMGDTPLMDAPSAMRPTSMAGLMDAIALYDNAKYSIGYSYYAYAANMYGTGTELKFVAVDGVYPDETTIAGDTYPLVSRNYAILRADSGAPAYAFVSWILSERGQKVVEESGYFSLRGKVRTPAYSLGTGPERPAEQELGWSYVLSYGTMEKLFSKETGLSGLRDKAAEQKINDLYYSAVKGVTVLQAAAMVQNGYLRITFTTALSDVIPRQLRTSSFVFDLHTGDVVEKLSDLYYRGTDYLKAIREYRPLAGSEEAAFYTSESKADVFAANGSDPRDAIAMNADPMEGMWEDPSVVSLRLGKREGATAVCGENGLFIEIFKETQGLSPEQTAAINDLILRVADGQENYARFYEEAVRYAQARAEEFGQTPQEVTLREVRTALVGNNFLNIFGYGISYCYYLDTGEEVDLSALDVLLAPGWREEVRDGITGEKKDISALDLSEYQLCFYDSADYAGLTKKAVFAGKDLGVRIPLSFLRDGGRV